MKYRELLKEGYFSGVDTNDSIDELVPHSYRFDIKKPDGGGRFTRLLIFRKSISSLTYEYVEKSLNIMDNYLAQTREVKDFQTYAIYSGNTGNSMLPDNVYNDTEKRYISGFSLCIAMDGSFSSMKKIIKFVVTIDSITYTTKKTAATKLYFLNIQSGTDMIDMYNSPSSWIPSIIMDDSIEGIASGTNHISSAYTLEAIMLICQFLWKGNIESLIAESAKNYGYKFRNYIESAVKVYLKREADYQNTKLEKVSLPSLITKKMQQTDFVLDKKTGYSIYIFRTENPSASFMCKKEYGSGISYELIKNSQAESHKMKWPQLYIYDNCTRVALIGYLGVFMKNNPILPQYHHVYVAYDCLCTNETWIDEFTGNLREMFPRLNLDDSRKIAEIIENARDTFEKK